MKYLCRAWGETDLPCAEVVVGKEGIRRFFIREWFGNEDHKADDGTNMLNAAMEDIAKHDWEEEWKANFEIGGVSVERVYSPERFTSYEVNILNGVADWLETRSNTIWARGIHDGLMRAWAKDLRAILA